MVLSMFQIAAADPQDGPAERTTKVNALSTDVYELVFRGDEITVIEVQGDGDTDLDLFVYDEDGNLIASDTDTTDRCAVSITPRWTGKFTIHVENLGSVYNKYTIEVY